MIPILFEKTETSFTTNGVGRLSDAISCIVTEERNGAYELEMEYVEGGAHSAEIDIDSIIYAKPAAYSTDQPFRVYKMTKPLNRRFKIYARHISYDLANIIVMPCGPYYGASTALAGMAANTTGMNGFTIGTVTASQTGTFTVNAPASFRNWIGGREGSILDIYGGELEWDKKVVKLHQSRGTNRGLTLRYGKNISDISQDQDNGWTVTGLVPYYKDANEVVLTLPEKAVYKSGASYSTPTRLTNLDCQSMIDEQAIREANPSDTEAQIEGKLINAMRTAAQAYADANLTGVPDSSIEVSFVNLGDTEEYKAEKSLFTQAGLCDTVTVYFERLGIQAQEKIIKTVYNTLLERFESLTIGKARANLGDKFGSISASVSGSAAATEKHAADMAAEREAEAIAAAEANAAAAIATNTALITGVDGGYVRINRDSNGKPYEILIMDNPDIAQAVKLWRWNINGLGYSETGYNGTYTTALSMAGIFNTDFIAANTLSGTKIIAGTLDAGKITTGTLDASLIKTGLLEDYAGKNFINMLTGAFSLCNGNMFYNLNDGDFVQLANNLSLKLNGIPLAGDIYKNVGVDYDSSKATGTHNTVILRPYDCVFNGVIKNITAYTYQQDGRELIKDVPVPDGLIGSSTLISICVPGHTVNSGGGIVYKTDPEIIWINHKYQRFNTQEEYDAWAQDYQFCKKVTKGGYIYGVYGYIELRSSASADEYIEITATYPTWNHDSED